MNEYRLNSPSTSAVVIEALGHRMHISQDPNSNHLGTTVWDSSMVFIKFLEKNSRKGRFSPSKLKGKRVIELGAGCGLAGLGMALLGCNVVSTDQIEVLPLLTRNVERNTSWIMQGNPDSGCHTASYGSIEVAELDWGNKDHIKAVCPPFDYIIGTDVVYAEHLLEPLLHTIMALSGPRTAVMLGYEIRSTTVHERMIQNWKDNFVLKSVPKAKMDSKYQHPSIQLFIMERKAPPKHGDNMQSTYHAPLVNNGSDAECDDCIGGEAEADGSEKDANEFIALENRKVDDWEARRHGAMAARLLRDAKIASND